MQTRLWEAPVCAWAGWWPGKYDSLNAIGSTSVALNCSCSHKRPGSLAGTCAWPVTLCCCASAQRASPAPRGLRGPRGARILEGYTVPSPGNLPDPTNPHLLHCRQIIYHWPTGEAMNKIWKKRNILRIFQLHHFHSVWLIFVPGEMWGLASG